MKGIKIMLLGIAIILLGIFGLSVRNDVEIFLLMAGVCPPAGILIVLIGLFVKDK